MEFEKAVRVYIYGHETMNILEYLMALNIDCKGFTKKPELVFIGKKLKYWLNKKYFTVIND